MGRSYWFECARCGHRAKVSGKADRGLDLFVQTILCRDCKALFDAVTRLRVTNETCRHLLGRPGGLAKSGFPKLRAKPTPPPNFQAALNRVQFRSEAVEWITFPLQCPTSASHQVRAWNDPDKCPRCGALLERHALPFRIWD
jgi:hypothetical protein